MTVAREIAVQLQRPVLTDRAGAYYLGATTPDIRVLTKWERSRTHYFDLRDYGHQRSTDQFLAGHPELASPACLKESTAAFVAGYISHLEMDEAWICDVYRPCFGEHSPLKGDVLANVLDRVLQFELDRRERKDGDTVREIHRDLLDSTVEETIGFLDLDRLLEWRDISSEILEREPTWDRFGVIASRHLRAYGVESEQDLAHFLRNVPDLLDQAVREVTPERLEAFRAESRRRATKAIRAYLS